MHSGTPHLRPLAEAAAASSWGPMLPVHVRRASNFDPDRLSHPEEEGAVLREAEAAGFECVRLAPLMVEADWAPLRAAMAVGVGRGVKRRGGPRRGRATAARIDAAA